MSLIIDSVKYIINSANRTSGTNENFQYLINIPKNHSYDRVVCVRAEIPKSYWMIQTSFNQMTLLENGVSTTITVPAGNYNARSWTTLIGSLLTSSSSQGWTYTISFPNSATQVDSGLFTYSVSGNSGVEPSFIFPATGVSTVFEQFGFNADSTNVFVGDSLTATNVCKFQQEDVLLLHSDIAYNNDQSIYTDVLQEFYAGSSVTYGNVQFNNEGTIEADTKMLLTEKNNTYKFTLTNENNQLMNLNGLNFVFTLLIYKKDNINFLISRVVQRMIIKESQPIEQHQEPDEDYDYEEDEK